jgi:sigma-B regulation protein RsbU (phosphoserine phosphatase)
MINVNDYATSIVEAAPMAMFMIDTSGRIVVANREAAQVFHYGRDDLLGRHVNDLIPEPARGGHSARIAEFFANPEPRVMGAGRDLLAVDGEGHQFPVEIGLTSLSDDEQTYAVAVVADITRRKQIEREFTAARLVQTAMLPTSLPLVEGLDIAARSLPAESTGGDFFDFLRLSDGSLGVAIGDASGHGFSAALVVATAKAYLRALVSSGFDLATLMRQTNKLLLEDLSEGRFVTLFFGILDTTSWSYSYAGAGHDGYLLDADANVKKRLHSTGPPLGWFPEGSYESDEVSLSPGDLLLLMTDGLTEAFSAGREMFGRDRIIEVIRRTRDADSEQIVEEIFREVASFSEGTEQADDMTIIVMKHDSR